MLSYAKNLQFEEDPDYGYIRSLLEDVFNGYHYSYDFNFDWNNNKSKRILVPDYRPLMKPPDDLK